MGIQNSDWRDKTKKGDISEACRRAGVSTTVYYESQNLAPDNWTAGMARANIELKKIVEEREKFIKDSK